jgi:hypothetical protein
VGVQVPPRPPRVPDITQRIRRHNYGDADRRLLVLMGGPPPIVVATDIFILMGRKGRVGAGNPSPVFL